MIPIFIIGKIIDRYEQEADSVTDHMANTKNVADTSVLPAQQPANAKNIKSIHKLNSALESNQITYRKEEVNENLFIQKNTL